MKNIAKDNDISVSEAIKFLESTVGIKISPEKKQVLKYDYRTPVLICSAAGSGKTTLIMLSCLTKIMTGELSSRQILGITFSHKARIDMQKKYKLFSSKFSKAGIHIPNNKIPKFTTFHALFLHLLRGIKKFKVLPTRHFLKAVIYRAIKYPLNYISDHEIAKKIFNFRNRIISDGYSFDGLSDRLGRKYDADSITDLSEKYNTTHNVKFYQDYISVITAYQRYKAMNNQLDFDDMETKVLKALRHPAKARLIKQAMKGYKICFIDEFQDINNIQWEIMKKILPKEAKQHIAAIGDDDQSIYSFRGSNPKIILNFAKKVPNTKTFHLSTNYRTGGHILNCVKPLIEKNHYRLNKDIKSDNPNDGKLIEFRSVYPKISDSQLLFKQLLKQYKDQSIPDNQIAVLCRYNIDKELVIDFLANHHIYIKTNPQKIIQNQKDYKIYTGVTYALWKNSFPKLRKYLMQIGFRFYKFHVKNVLKYAKKSTLKKISTYLKYAEKYDEKYGWNLRMARNQRGLQTMQEDDKVYHYFEDVRQKINTKNYPLQVFFDAVDMTKIYYEYMEDHGYITINFKIVRQYLKDQFRNATSLNEFFAKERNKKLLLRKKRNSRNSKITVISIHQSKGLQFDYVYLYDLTKKSVNNGMISVNNVFYPNLKFKQFITDSLYPHDKKVSNQNKKISSFGKIISGRYNQVINHITHYHKNRINNYPDMNDLMNAHNCFNIKENLMSLYHNMMSISTEVEEERRLVYVAITRAKKCMYINYNNYSSPLLDELKVGDKNIYFINSNGKRENEAGFKKHTGLSYAKFDNMRKNFEK